MADKNMGSDALLTTELTDNDRVALTRAATDQQIATMTVKDFRAKLAGMDYTSLTEHAIPGKFFMDFNGQLKQVYSRAFIGTFPAGSWDLHLFNATQAKVVNICGYIAISDGRTSNIVKRLHANTMDSLNGLIWLHHNGDPDISNGRYSVYVEYIHN